MRKYDFFLIGALLLLGLLLYPLLISREDAGTVSVYAAGKLIHTCGLEEDSSFTWSEGEDFVQIEVADGAVRVAASSCPDKTCVQRGAQSRSGSSIICLPNRISVILEGEAGADAPDAVLY